MTSVVGPRRSPLSARPTETETARETSSPRAPAPARNEFEPSRQGLAGLTPSLLTKLGSVFVPGAPTVANAAAPSAKAATGTAATPLTPSTSPNAAIQDNATVTSTLDVADDAKVESLKLDLDIAHTYRGDLTVTLTSPSGKSAVVSNRQGGSADDLKGSFDLKDFAGEPTKGTWKLEVKDTAKGDIGTLKQWGMNIVPETKAPEPDPEPSDDPFDGLRDDALLKAVRDSASGKKVVSYNEARNIIFSSLDVNAAGNVECVYTGVEVKGGKIPNSSVMNVEHTWPQSKGATGAAKSDLHHLFPTDSKANSRRSSFPFGEVVNVKWSHNGAKLGTDAKGNTVFEPPDSHKGNVARAMFYFSSTYNKPIPADEEAALKAWNKLDGVDTAEIERNRRVANIQGNTNAFVDNADLADRVKDF
ncbi:endonuclease [Myxococcus sp. CA051A]|uniref:Convertase n=1 Tax=Myxococcus llanfairpwllgwyngyllgogerychwyrndrobwllllantysiliogogogochensis TaxID=2590453 RepID=A0A540WJY1_9BACT|nr:MULTISPECIES: endonuclease [Myxococcus]NTX08307.1 endonuclease [Myxococcus sp. CA040A]NTX14738.1 endonuclease [Myxococcus sp. CA056]NTX41498.1 endonuclease [Myxococcus sp. CA033]NTX58071.1 endonuclease [Myxococcus sp. CA039A]NTX67091.1 endonuclease [Myxococcus sp. CA051A]